MILFTADIDWAPEEVISDTIQLFEKYNVCCTFFATHYSDVLIKCNRELFELGLHPNFNKLLQGSGGDPDEILNSLKNYYPEAKGVRSHSLTQNGWLLNKYKEIGMLYEVNHFLPYHQSIFPYKLWNGLLRIPFNWEDDYHFALDLPFNNSNIDLNDTGLNIFNFHPIHIFLNSENNVRYLKTKDCMQDVTKLRPWQNKSNVKGTRDILIDLLEHVRENKVETFKLIDIYSKTTLK